MTNFEIAKADADKVDELIIETLQNGDSFCVEAGAGSGKTYSLNKVIEWLQTNKLEDYRRKKQNIICITFTNAAVNVISERLSKESFIIPSTIHSFAWNAIKQYQSFLISTIASDPEFQTNNGNNIKITEVTYTLGHRYNENGIQYLFHGDVLKLFCTLLDNKKFRRLFSDRYPLILIDEYQDSYKPIVDRFINYFIAIKQGTQFGFFGDSWQTIYQSNQACGPIENDNLKIIQKGSNFRSAPRIVELLNVLRPELLQKSAIDDFYGEVKVITCDDYKGYRNVSGYLKGDLPTEELRTRLIQVSDKIKRDSAQDENLKILMITHKILAKQQGYDQLLNILGNKLKDKEDPFLMFFMETVEPIFKALNESNMQLLFDTLGIERYPIKNKSDKIKWKNFKIDLKKVREKRAIDVFKLIKGCGLIPIPPKLDELYNQYEIEPKSMYVDKVSIKTFLDLDYEQFVCAIEFLFPESLYSTEHGVKGEEYDNVVFVISKGWPLYQFDYYAPMITGNVKIPKDKKSSYERNRNLFYVCCSRPKKRLFFFISLSIDSTFRNFLKALVGDKNICTYKQFMEEVPSYITQKTT